MQKYRFPLTLTLVQFAFVSIFSLLYGLIVSAEIKRPTMQVLKSTAPLGFFQIFGHILSSTALTFVSVSFSHTIKALSPLFTVAIYTSLYQISYSRSVYVSLATLTIGVIMVCATNLQFHLIGFLCSLGSTFTFVMYKYGLILRQNIACKHLFNTSNHSSFKLDKLNLLFYPATISFILMFPFWLLTDGLPIFTLSHESLKIQMVHLFILNGASHFAQNILAFNILSLVSPVTYSIASLIKRIFVIAVSIIYFGDIISVLQGCGISITFFGLYMYNKARGSVEKNLADSQEVFTLPTSSASDRKYQKIRD